MMVPQTHAGVLGAPRVGSQMHNHIARARAVQGCRRGSVSERGPKKVAPVGRCCPLAAAGRSSLTAKFTWRPTDSAAGRHRAHTAARGGGKEDLGGWLWPPSGTAPPGPSRTPSTEEAVCTRGVVPPCRCILPCCCRRGPRADCFAAASLLSEAAGRVGN